MKRIALLFILCTVLLPSEELESYRWDFDEKNLQEIAAKDNTSLENQAEALFYLYQVQMDSGYPLSMVQQTLDKALEKNLKLIEKKPNQTGVLAVRLSRIYSDKIFDAASWMKYSVKSEKWRIRARSLVPENIDLQILDLMNLLYFPENAGGDREGGLALLQSLLDGNPENPELLMFQIALEMDEGNYEDTEPLLIDLLDLYPNHRPAKKILFDLKLSLKNLNITEITVSKDFQSRLEPVEKIIVPYIGQPYSMETKTALSRDLETLPVVNSLTITAQEIEGTVSLELHLDEEKTSFYGILFSVGLGGQNDGVPEFTGIPVPVLLYGNQNIFGRGHQINVICAWVFYGLDYTIPEQPGMPFNLQFSTQIMLLPGEETFYSQGEAEPWSQEKNSYTFYGGIQKEWMGFSLSLGLASEYTHYQNPKGGMILSENPLEFSGILSLSNLKKMSLPGSLPQEGITFNGQYEILYIPEYTEWGPGTELFKHDDLPAGKFTLGMGYQKELFSGHQAGAEVVYFGGQNLYQSDLWSIGQGGMMSTDPSLPGYYSGEFLLKTGVIGGVSWHWSPKEDLILYLNHKVLLTEDSIKQGSTSGLSFKAPGDILVDLSGNIGWDGERERGRGWQINLTAARLFF